jgi:hypothetical protein
MIITKHGIQFVIYIVKQCLWSLCGHTYVESQPNPTVDGYISWVKEQQDPIYQIKYEQVKKYFIVI